MGKIIGKLLFLKELTQSLIDYLGNPRFLPLGTLFISSIRPISKGKIWCPNSVHVTYKIIQIDTNWWGKKINWKVCLD